MYVRQVEGQAPQPLTDTSCLTITMRIVRETPYKIQRTREFPPLRIKSLLESNLLKSKLLVRGLGVIQCLLRYVLWTNYILLMCSCTSYAFISNSTSCGLGTCASLCVRELLSDNNHVASELLLSPPSLCPPSFHVCFNT